MKKKTESKVKGNDFEMLKGMPRYIGVKVISAKPMSRLEYNEFRGRKLPSDENGDDAGRIVQYSDGYISWSPADQFEREYRELSGVKVDIAMKVMKKAGVISSDWEVVNDV